jgi:hypothetical protein
LIEGGSKARVLEKILPATVPAVYASPVYGHAQIALARVLGEHAHIFCAARTKRHVRTEKAQALGATIHEVRPGYLSVATARARAFAAESGATLASQRRPCLRGWPRLPEELICSRVRFGLLPGVGRYRARCNWRGREHQFTRCVSAA